MPAIPDTPTILWVKTIPEEIFIYSIKHFVVVTERELIYKQENPKHPSPFNSMPVTL